MPTSNLMRTTVLAWMTLLAPAGHALAEAPLTMAEMQKRYDALQRRVAALEAEKTSIKLGRAQREEILKLVADMNADASARSGLPGWLQNFTIYGDLRLRYQAECYNDRMHHGKTRNRGRFRLRVGARKTWWDGQMEIGFRLASGADDDPNSANQTMDAHFTAKPVGWDLAYAKIAPKVLKGFTIVGGKMRNPLFHTSLVWDSDVNPEGVWAQYKAHMLGPFKPFVNAGYFIVEEEATTHDVVLVAYQAGFEWQMCKNAKWTSALTYYDYDHLEANFFGSFGNHEAGGRLVAEEFQMINLTNKVDWKMTVGGTTVPMSAYFDWVHNCADADSAHGYDDQSDGYAVGLKIGTNKNRGDCSFAYKYAYIEANATAAQFNDSDFGHANRKGHVFRVTYNIESWLTIGANLFWTEPVTGDDEHQDTVSVRADLIWKF